MNGGLRMGGTGRSRPAFVAVWVFLSAKRDLEWFVVFWFFAAHLDQCCNNLIRQKIAGKRAKPSCGAASSRFAYTRQFA